METGPVSRIRRVTLQPRKLLNRNPRELSITNFGSAGRFASRWRHNFTGRNELAPCPKSADNEFAFDLTFMLKDLFRAFKALCIYGSPIDRYHQSLYRLSGLLRFYPYRQ
jgi:hypothetical protein